MISLSTTINLLGVTCQVEKRTKDKRQKLQDQHKASVTKMQKEIEDRSRADKRKLYV